MFLKNLQAKFCRTPVESFLRFRLLGGFILPSGGDLAALAAAAGG